MNLFYDLFPLFPFFMAYKFLGIYSATAVAIVATIAQVTYTRLKHKKFEIIQLVTCLMIVIFGGMTLLFHNPIFIKWKPTMINWILAILFWGSQAFTRQSLLEYLLRGKIAASEQAWRTLNTMWISFFLFAGTVNILVAYNFDTDTWVNFKVFGMFGLTLIFGLIQAVYLSKHGQMLTVKSTEINHVDN